jgi:hypothetical protein
VIAVQERPAGRPTSSARPAGARAHLATPCRYPRDEYERLVAVGVSPWAAQVLAARRDRDEHAYRRAIKAGRLPTPEQRAANAAAEHDRRYLRRSA